MKEKKIIKYLVVIFGVIISTLMFSQPVKAEEFVVVIDPGHGGGDPGAYRSFSNNEKYYNFKIANYCKQELEKYSGIRVYLTRTKDVFLQLDQRAAIAKEYNADLFVSFHNNASVNEFARGADIYITQNTTSIKYNPGITIFGNYVLDNLQKLGIQRRGVSTRDLGEGYYSFGGRKDYYGVIRGGVTRQIPSCIIEHAFVSNRSDVSSFLNSDAKLKKLGIADAKAILKYFGLKDPAAPKLIELNQTSATIFKNEVVTLDALVLPYSLKGSKVTWTSSNNKIATVDKEGNITGISSGTATITASTYNDKQVKCKVKVNEEVNTLNLSEEIKVLKVGEQFALKGNVLPAKSINTGITFSNTDKSSLYTKYSVTGNTCIITAKKAGYVIYTVKTANGHKKDCVVWVKNETNENDLNNSENIIYLEKDKTQEIKHDIEGTGLRVPSAYKAAISIEGNKVKSLSESTGIVEAVVDNQVVAIWKIENKCMKAKEIAFKNTSVTLYKGNTYSQPPVINSVNSKSKDVTWKSSNPAVATVSGNSAIVPVKNGTTMITARAKDGSGIVGKYKVTVKTKATSIAVNKKSVAIFTGDSLKLKGVVSPAKASNQSISWSTSNSKVAKVSGSGKISGLSAGIVTITAKSADGNYKAKTKVTVIVKPMKITTYLTKATSQKAVYIKAGDSYKIAAKVKPVGASQDLIWSTSNSRVAKVNSKGTVTGKTAGAVTITAKTPDGRVSKKCTIVIVNSNIKAAKLKIDQKTVKLKIGESAQIKTTVTPFNATITMSYTSSNPAVVKVNKYGTITARKTGTATITATASGGKKITCKVKVTK